MTLTTILTAIGGIVVIFDAGAQISSAAARLVNSCTPLVQAIRNLRSVLREPEKEMNSHKSVDASRELRQMIKRRKDGQNRMSLH